MAPDIPGYYFDPVKKKYFKIEKSHTAPPSAAWSSDEVKKRRVDDAAAEASRKRERLLRNHIKRNAALETDIVARGRLMRELGVGVGGGGGGGGDTVTAAWARGLVDKGSISFMPPSNSARGRYANMPCLYVGGDDDKTGLGVAYATLDEETLVGSYIATDNNDTISFSQTAPESTGQRQGLRAEMIRCPQMSSIRYHRPSHKILLTSREPDHSCGLYFFSPLLSEESDYRPQWLLGETSHYQRLYIRHRLRDEWLVHQSTPAPASSDLLCVIGTNAGILRVRSNETMAWISSAPSSSSSSSGSSGGRVKPPPQSTASSKHVPQEVFDQDFQHGNHNVLLAGGRQPRLWLTDLRAPEAQWSSVPHASSIAHLRSVNEHQVLVAGLRSSMCLYDMRFFGRRNPNYDDDDDDGGGGGGGGGGGDDGARAAAASDQGGGGRRRGRRSSNDQSSRRGGGVLTKNGAKPILTFEGYRNEAHLHTGWDVSTELGVVAAAHDDGTVKLFSLKSGRRLAGSSISSGGGGGGSREGQFARERGGGGGGAGYALDSVRSDTPIRALTFRRMPRETMPSLFVGQGPLLRKFSLGVEDLAEEG